MTTHRHTAPMTRGDWGVFHASFFRACRVGTLLSTFGKKLPWMEKTTQIQRGATLSTLSTLYSVKREKEEKERDCALFLKSFGRRVESLESVAPHA